jgi:hypothetical protein
MALSDTIREHLPKLQFVAVAMTIALGSHTVYDRFLRNQKPVIVWENSGFSIIPGPTPHTWNVTVSRRKFRDDCPLRSFDVSVVDSEGFSHVASSSTNRSIGISADGKAERFRWIMKIADPSTVANGRARLVGTLVYECREGQQVIEYPRSPELEFEVIDGRK